MYDMRGSYACVPRWRFPMMFCYVGDICITEIISDEVTMKRNRQDKFRGRCSYGKSLFYILYAGIMNDTHVYTQFLI